MNLFRRSMKEVIKIVIKCKFMKLWGNIVYLVNDLNPDLAEIMRRDRCVCGLVMRAASGDNLYYLHIQILLFQDCHLSFHAASVILSSFDLGGFDTIYVHVLDTHLCGKWVKYTAEYFFPYHLFSMEMEIIDYLILQWFKILISFL